jgi:DNA polymerase III subunit alpha
MYIHLRLHTEFSVVDGTVRVEEAVKAAGTYGQGALAVTDLNNLFGAVKFYKEARNQGVKPILGAEIWLEGYAAAESGKEAVLSRVVLLVQNKQGYLNLSEMLARAWTQNVVRANGVVKLDWLKELNAGLILLSGAQAGPVGQALVQGDAQRASDIAMQLASSFTHRFYIELQRAGRIDDEAHVSAAATLAARLKLPVVATHPIQFLAETDYDAHEARVCISEGEILGNARRVRKFTREQYFKSPQQMQNLFADLPSAIANTAEIAKRCSISIELGKPKLPEFPIPEINGQRMAPQEYFSYLSHEGLKERMAHLYRDDAARATEMPRYLERLEFEINTIVKMGFPGYFLIVGDFIP